MSQIVIVTTCPPDESELLPFLVAFSALKEGWPDLFFSLFLVDDIGVFISYSDAIKSEILRISGDQGVVLTSKKGQFYALYDVALNMEASAVVTMDPDMALNLHDVPKFYELVSSGVDLVFGSRSARHDVSAFRVFASKLHNLIVRTITGLSIVDINTPMVMFNGDIARALKDFPREAGHPKLYFPYILGNRFCQVNICVMSAKRKSSYSWARLARLAFRQLHDAFLFSRYVKSLSPDKQDGINNRNGF